MSEEPKEPTEAEETAADEAADDLTDKLTGDLVEVTDNDIMIGECGSPAHCPVALAVRRTISKQGHAVSHVFVSGRKIACKVAGLPTIRFAMPLEIARWIQRFDSGAYGVEPVNFTLEMFTRQWRRMSRWKRKRSRKRRSAIKRLSWAFL